VDIKALLLKYIDLRGLAVEGILKGIVEVKLRELAAQSDNKIDDALVEFLMPQLEGAAIAAIDKVLEKI
jgi:hypothetical protein